MDDLKQIEKKSKLSDKIEEDTSKKETSNVAERKDSPKDVEDLDTSSNDSFWPSIHKKNGAVREIKFEALCKRFQEEFDKAIIKLFPAVAESLKHIVDKPTVSKTQNVENKKIEDKKEEKSVEDKKEEKSVEDKKKEKSVEDRKQEKSVEDVVPVKKRKKN